MKRLLLALPLTMALGAQAFADVSSLTKVAALHSARIGKLEKEKTILRVYPTSVSEQIYSQNGENFLQWTGELNDQKQEWRVLQDKGTFTSKNGGIYLVNVQVTVEGTVYGNNGVQVFVQPGKSRVANIQAAVMKLKDRAIQFRGTTTVFLEAGQSIELDLWNQYEGSRPSDHVNLVGFDPSNSGNNYVEFIQLR